MYLSDYLYANNAYFINPATSLSCSDNWICASTNESEWLITPVNSLGFVFGTDTYGDVGQNEMKFEYAVRPVLYLKSGIKVTGTGDINSKYQIVS